MAVAMVLDQDMAERLVMTLESAEASIKRLGKMYDDAEARADANTMLTIRQACEYLGGCTEATLLHYRKLGLSYYKKGKDGVWYRRGDIDAWLESGKVSRNKQTN